MKLIRKCIALTLCGLMLSGSGLSYAGEPLKPNQDFMATYQQATLDFEWLGKAIDWWLDIHEFDLFPGLMMTYFARWAVAIGVCMSPVTFVNELTIRHERKIGLEEFIYKMNEIGVPMSSSQEAKAIRTELLELMELYREGDVPGTSGYFGKTIPAALSDKENQVLERLSKFRKNYPNAKIDTQFTSNLKFATQNMWVKYFRNVQARQSAKQIEKELAIELGNLAVRKPLLKPSTLKTVKVLGPLLIVGVALSATEAHAQDTQMAARLQETPELVFRITEAEAAELAAHPEFEQTRKTYSQIVGALHQFRTEVPEEVQKEVLQGMAQAYRETRANPVSKTKLRRVNAR